MSLKKYFLIIITLELLLYSSMYPTAWLIVNSGNVTRSTFFLFFAIALLLYLIVISIVTVILRAMQKFKLLKWRKFSLLYLNPA